MKRYSEYKDSGIEWIGEIPSHWKKSKVGYIGNYINGFAFNPSQWSDEGYKIIRIQNLTDSSKSFNFYSGKIDKKYIIKKGDILISWSATLDTFIWDDDEDAVLNQHIFKVVVDEDKICKSYYVWLANWFISEMQNEKHGSTMQHLTKNTFDKFVVYLPSMEEQVYLAKYLDKKTSQIDNLISKKEELIETLKASRTKLISETVTKGFDKNVPMKDSGVEWIGDIPSHWEIKKIKYLFDVIGGGTPSSSEESYWDGDIRWITPKDIDEAMYVDDTSRTISMKGVINSSAKIIKQDSIVITTRAPIGNICINRYEATTNQGCHSLINTKNMNIKFYYYYLNSIKDILVAYGKGTTFIELSKQGLEDIFTVHVPIDEQNRIADYLENKTSNIDNLISVIKEQIEVLKKAKQKLITEVITGKIDITNL